MEAPLVPEVLLQHGQFVRALARSLLRDAHAAEDVAQETWARYLERGPTAGSGVRRWLAVVARNLAANLGRGERRREARDREAARPEALPPAQEELEHAELLGAVVEAVLALEEPYRETIVARYYRGLDAQAIAARSGTTAATVRSREHRALEKLRERLDRRFAGERRAWAAVLARIAGPPAGESVGAPASAWPLAWTAAIPVLAIAAGAVLWWRARGEPAVSLAQPMVSAATNEPGPPAAVEPHVPVPVIAPVEQRTPVRGEPSSRASATNAALAEIRGRFVFPGGAPAVGAQIDVDGWDANQERVLQHGEPENWVDPAGVTDGDGRFSLRFDPPRAFQFSLDANAPGHAGASWRWSEIRPGATVDIGEIELPVGGTIEGRMVDAQGKALVGEHWSVYARTVGLGEWEGRDESQVIAPVDPATASFRLEYVWPCRIELSGDSRVANNIEGPKIVVVSGETTHADIVYSGPSNPRRITVVTFCEPLYTESNPDPEHMRLIGPSGESRTAREIEGSSQSYSFDDLGPGTYTAEIDDPRYLPWTRTGLAPGTSVDANLVGSAALRLSVIDAAGQAVERYAVRVTLRSSEWSPNEFELHDGKTVLAGGLLRGVVPGDYTVAIRCADGATARCEVDGLASGETRAVQLELGKQLFVAGRVVHSGGDGVLGAVVLLLTPAQQDDSDASPIMELGGRTDEEQRYRWQLAKVETDAGGVFRFDVTNPGPYLLRARADGSQAFSPIFTLESVRDDLELVLPRSGAVRGRVLAPPGASFDGLAVWIAPSSLWNSQVPPGLATLQIIGDMRDSVDHAMAELRADGSFELEHLPPGPSRAFLVVAQAVRGGFYPSEDGISGAERLGDFDVPSGGLLERDFTAPELPGWISFELRVNGERAPFHEVRLFGAYSMGGRTDASGCFGPKRVPAGTWSVRVENEDAGWEGMIPTTIVVEPGREANAILDAQVIRGTLECVDADGRPIASETLTLLHFDESRPGKIRSYGQIKTPRTDSHGRLELLLMPGEYGLARVPYDFNQPWREVERPHVPLTWTSTGPLVKRVQL